jgi:hypothetical protein
VWVCVVCGWVCVLCVGGCVCGGVCVWVCVCVVEFARNVESLSHPAFRQNTEGRLDTRPDRKRT